MKTFSKSEEKLLVFISLNLNEEYLRKSISIYFFNIFSLNIY